MLHVLKSMSCRQNIYCLLVLFFITDVLITKRCLSETEKGIFNAILEGNLDLQSSPWPSISTVAKDLIKKMLTVDPKKRITAADALGEYMTLSNSRIVLLLLTSTHVSFPNQTSPMSNEHFTLVDLTLPGQEKKILILNVTLSGEKVFRCQILLSQNSIAYIGLEMHGFNETNLSHAHCSTLLFFWQLKLQ